MKKYKAKSEYKVDLDNENVGRIIKEAKEVYLKFLGKYSKKLDFAKPKRIKAVYEIAEKMGILKKAEELRELLFGKDMHFYGVSYLWDACGNHCAYCPGSVPNRQKAIKEGKVYPLRELTVEQAIKDTEAVMKDGHTHMCYLTGSAPGRELLPDKMVSYIKKIDKLGLEEIILNIEPATQEGFIKMRKAVKITPLQFRVFQETYNRETYNKMHPKGDKADYDFRRESQARAIKAGFDNVGLGALLGLHQYPIEEIESLRKHAEELENIYGKKPARVCLPSANELENIGIKIPYRLEPGQIRPKQKGEKLGKFKYGSYEMANELLYALARLAMPTINLVDSERDTPEMLEILDKYATCTTLNVHPGVGDNAKVFPCSTKSETHFEQATTFPRNPKKTIEKMKQAGYDPIILSTHAKTANNKIAV
jgi:biotin synthase-like enzyme